MTDPVAFFSSIFKGSAVCMYSMADIRAVLMVPMLIRKVQTIAGCSMMEGFLIPPGTVCIELNNVNIILGPCSLPNS